MSGYKKVSVSISESEYHRLVESENKLRFQQSTQAAQKANANAMVDEAVEQVWKQLQDMEQRQSNFLTALDSVHPAIRQVEDETARQIIEQAVEFANDLNAFKDEFIDSAQELVTQQSEYFTQAILREHQQHQQSLLRLQRREQRAVQSAQQKQSLASEWIATCDQLSQFIQSNYRYELHLPGRLSSIHQELELAEQNLTNNILDAAILGAQQAYLRLSQLRIELEKSEQEWNTLHHSALMGLKGLMNQIESARRYPAIDLEGNELPEMIPVDIWTNGRLSQLSNEVEQVFRELDQSGCTQKTNQLQSILNNFIPQRIESLVDIIHDARKAVLSSQMRINIAEVVVAALEKQGFALADAAYELDEMRNPFHARLVSLDGSEVMIRVVPSKDTGSNDIFMENHDAEERTDYELKNRASEITQSLGQYGLAVTNMQILKEQSINGSEWETPQPAIITKSSPHQLRS